MVFAALSVRQLMVPHPTLVPPSQPLRDVIGLMAERDVGALLVGEGQRLHGIFSERDLLRHAAVAEPGWEALPVERWMTRDVVGLAPDATWEQARALMDSRHVRHLPVLEGGQVVGLVTARDLMARSNEHLNGLVEQRTRELREAYERLRERDTELRMHMTVAGRLQARLLPGIPPDWPELAWAAHYQPLDPLGGDHYDFALPDDRRLGVLIADATGHSIPAAMVAIMARAAFAAAARANQRPGDVLADMNHRLHGLTGEHFVSAFYGIFDRETRLFTFANAGHPLPFRYDRAARAATPLTATGLLLGILPAAVYEEASVRLGPGDRLLFYTDGVVDCLGECHPQPGLLQLAEFLEANHDQSARSLVQRLVARLDGCRGQRPTRDDMTILAAQVPG